MIDLINKCNYFKVVILSAVLLISINNLCAQSPPCPDDIPPYDDEWIHTSDSVYVSFDGGLTFCWWHVHYCWRELSFSPAPTIDIYFLMGELQSGDCKGDISPWESIRLLTEALIQQNPGNLNWPCLDCPSVYWEYRVFWAACYNEVTLESCGTSGYCKYRYNVCCENGVRIVSYNGSEKIGEDCPNGCFAPCDY